MGPGVFGELRQELPVTVTRDVVVVYAFTFSMNDAERRRIL